MADKKVSDLIAAEQIYEDDVFVLEQDGTAKKLTGQILMNWLTAAADGHGGISDISKISTSGLKDTYRITLADKTAFDFVVTNGAKGDPGFSIFYANHEVNYTEGSIGSHVIAKTFIVTNGRTIQTGDLIVTSNGILCKVTSVSVSQVTCAPLADISGEQGVPGTPGDKGDPGQDGISATHSWNGTVLTVTSASGSSSADLKGGKGDPGSSIFYANHEVNYTEGSIGSHVIAKTFIVTNGRTIQTGDLIVTSNGILCKVTSVSVSQVTCAPLADISGEKGDPGYTPKKGVDYWTPADKTEIAEEVKKTVTPEAIGAVAKTGDTMTGALEIKPTANPHRTKLNKNSVNGEDYGTVLDDFNENNGNVSLTVFALDDKMTFTNLDGDEFEVAHAGNLQELLCTNLGYIEDIADYDASTVEELLDMLVEPGKYTFTDENPYQYFVEVREGEGINDPLVFQSYWSTEHGLSRILFRTGNLGGDEPYWGNWTCLNDGFTDLGNFDMYAEDAMNDSQFIIEGKYRFTDGDGWPSFAIVECPLDMFVYQIYWTSNDGLIEERFFRKGHYFKGKWEFTEWDRYATDSAVSKIESRVKSLEESGGGSGGLAITDDGKGNVTINSSGSVSITDDGNGNVVIA